ncbi:hypothetical protein E4U41_004722 [Claviceps citrina]|nr:hypothetical protein E4U41_004722 [Claviceps citrina]
MFDIPDAKRVRREDLDDDDSSAAGGDSWSAGADGMAIDTELQARLHAQIAKSLGFGFDAPDASKAPDQTPRSCSKRGPDEDDEHDADADSHAGELEYEFRLFSSRRPAKVTLEDDEAATARQGGLVQPRPPSFYAAGSIPERLKSEYRFAAVSGEEVLVRSRRPPWGMAYPWKVTSIGVVVVTRGVPTPTPTPACIRVEHARGQEESRPGRTRPGKKRRIAERRRAGAERERQEAERKRAVDKEEHAKEKKKRLNRFKKLRKRAKNKEMKAGGGGEGDDGDGDGDGDGDECPGDE